MDFNHLFCSFTLGELEQIYVVNMLFSIASISIAGIGLDLGFSVLPLLHSVLRVTVHPIYKTQTTSPPIYILSVLYYLRK